MTDIRKNLFAGAALAAALFASEAAMAQQAEQAPASQETAAADNPYMDIVVTGRKRARAEEIQKTPVTITAFNAAQIERSVVKDLVDVGRMTPNAALQSSSQRGIQNFAIRGMGISGSTPSDEPAVGIFQDGIYWGSNYGALGDLFDMEGVEVLRGPQGTLFGRNVTGGAVLVRSARPTQDTLVKAMVGAGSYGLIEGTVVANAPVVKDVLAARIAVQARSTDGYFTDTNTNTSYGKTRSYLVRPSLKWTPSADLDVSLIGEWYSDKGDPVAAREVVPHTVGGQTLPEALGYVTPTDYWSVSPGERGFSDITVLFTSLEANYKLGSGVLTFVGGYREVSTRVLTDFDGAPVRAFLQGIRYDQDQISGELRYAGNIGELINFTTGLYYFKQHVNFGETRDLANTAITDANSDGVDDLGRDLATRAAQNPRTYLATNSLLDNESWAAFAEADINLTDRLVVTAGARYTEETKIAKAAKFGACTFDLVTCTYVGPKKYSGHNFSPKIGVSYKLDNQMVYASFTRGFRSGGFSLRGTPLFEPYKAETVSALEAGIKADFFNHHLRTNVSVFQNDFKNLQRTVLGTDSVAGVVQSVFNAADATVKGAELEVTVVPVTGLTLTGNYGYTDAKYKRFAGVANPSAREFVRVPADTYNVAANYETELGNGGKIAARVSGAFTGRYFYDDPNTLKQRSYLLIDASLAYTTSGGVMVTVYGKNLTKEKYSVWGSTLGSLGQNLFPGAPTTWGVRLSGSF